MADKAHTHLISIGELAIRSGMAASALRFYESRGLISSVRSGNQRRQFAREVLRRVAFIKAAQTAGLTLEEIENTLASLPDQRTPTKQDWEKLSRSWQGLIQNRINALTALRDQLTSCIGCGCLSLKSCALYNPEDIAKTRGNGARYLLGDKPGKLQDQD
ncbi:redox-sensitive transcriptional activator SoxR [Undibacterium sp. Ji50W]|uniref:redox-sensitive transcriptional activator SoxR n=1 Tax=Undibacterium sp. Ji50W TaxID=3413041 RepID=UPI003BF2618F